MKILRTKTMDGITYHLFSRFCLLATIGLALVAAGAQAQIAVPSGGAGPFTFDTRPPVTEWSTVRLPGANGDITNAAGLDTAVMTNAAANINQLLGSSATLPPSANNTSRWNSAGLYLQTRPTGVAYNILMATLRNDSGADKSTVILDYDFGVLFTAGTTIVEEVPGQRVYYSLSGIPGSWHEIADLEGGVAGAKHAEVALASVWETGAILYLAWADDNANAGTGTASGDMVEGAYTIDNLRVGFTIDTRPPTIVTQPHNTTVETCRATNLTVVADGATPLHYQWVHGSTSVGTDSATYAIPSASASDAGNYHVHVSNAYGAVDSATVTVTVVQDTDAPAVVSALARADGTNILISFSEKMDPLAADNRAAYHLRLASGGAAVSPSAAVLAANGTNATISFDAPRTANVDYQLTIDSNVSDCSGNPLSGGNQVALKYEVRLLSFEGTSWKYNDSGDDLGIDWRRDAGYEDNSWSDGLSVFDSKNSTNRGTIAGMPVQTLLPLHAGTYTATDLPAYYFRTHFNLATTPSHVLLLSLRTLSDDYDLAYLNNYDAAVHIRAGFTNDADAYTYSGDPAVGDAAVEGPFTINPTNLLAGENVIAVKEFQVNATSSDITFAYELTAIIDSFVAAGPRLSISRTGGTVTVTWVNQSDQLYEASSVTGPWSLVGSGGTYSVTPGTSPGARFYTLRR